MKRGSSIGFLGSGIFLFEARDPGFPLFEARDPGFLLFEARDSVFQNEIMARFGIESMRRRWDAKNNPRDHGIAQSFRLGLRD